LIDERHHFLGGGINIMKNGKMIEGLLIEGRSVPYYPVI
jgi:hypothetical protein